MYPPTKKVPEGRRKKAVAKLFYTLTENNHKLYIFICSQMVFFLRPSGTWKSFYQYIPPGLKPGAGFQRPDGAFLFSVMIFTHTVSLWKSDKINFWKINFFTLKHGKNICFLKNYGITVFFFASFSREAGYFCYCVLKIEFFMVC